MRGTLYKMKNIHLSASLREQLNAGASFLELIDYIHTHEGVKPYERFVVIRPLREAFHLTLSDIMLIVFSCHIFGGQYSVEIVEELFLEKVKERESQS